MSKETSEATATASESVAQKDTGLDFLKQRTESLLARRGGPAQAKAQPEPEEEVPSQTTEGEIADKDNAEVTDEFNEREEGQEPESSEENEDNLSKDPSEIDWESLTPQQIDHLAQKGKSRLLKRVAQLTAKQRQAEEDTARLQHQIQELQAKRLEPESVLKSKPKDNPFKDIKDINALQAEFQKAEEFIEFAEELLDQNDHLGYDDEIYTEGNTSYTKGQVKAALKVHRKNKSQFIPAQLQELQKDQAREAVRKNLTNQARKEIPWFDDDESDIKAEYKSVMSSPVMKEIMDKVPDARPLMDYLSAHAVNSIKGRKEIPITKKPSVQPSKTSAPSGSSTAKTEVNVGRKLRELEKKAKETGSKDDFIQLRAHSIAKRKGQSL